MTFEQLFQKFEVEKNAKNTVFAFILFQGLYNDFREFCNTIPPGTDPHQLCLAIMMDEAEKRENTNQQG